MNSKFFTENEDLNEIIFSSINNCNKDIKKISSGWTNIVFDIISNNEHYIVKFPRDQFWSNCIEKDALISNFVNSSIGINSAKINIHYNNNRPFLLYKKIDGDVLTEKIKILDKDEIKNITQDLAKIFYKFHSFDVKKLPDIAQNKFYDFITNIPKLNEDSYDYSLFNQMKNDEKDEKKVFIHGDLNIGNVLLDKNKRVLAIIDYAFAGIGDIYTDLSRMSCRTNDYFFELLLEEYEKISNIKLNREKIENRKILWKYIEDEYMKFMKIIHPEVKF